MDIRNHPSDLAHAYRTVFLLHPALADVLYDAWHYVYVTPAWDKNEIDNARAILALRAAEGVNNG